MEVALNIATQKRGRMALLASVLIIAAMSFAPATASATPPNLCSGHIAKGTAAEPGDNRVDFVLACARPLNGFSLISSNELESFDTDLQVFDRAGTLIPNEAFACEGDQPGFGVNCNGTYNGDYHVVKGSFLAANPVCDEPRTNARLIVSYATVVKGAAVNSLSGPFELGRPQGCPAPKKHAPAKKKAKKKH
jgi:hypothetical protein